MSEEDQDSVTVTEVKKQTVILAFEVVGTVMILWITFMGHDAASRQRFVMTSALRVKRFAQWNAHMWEDLAERAATVYNRNRM